MGYHIMLTYQRVEGREVQVMDFKEGRMIRFTLDELEKNELPEEMKKLIKDNIEKINEGRWDYKILK